MNYTKWFITNYKYSKKFRATFWLDINVRESRLSLGPVLGPVNPHLVKAARWGNLRCITWKRCYWHSPSMPRKKRALSGKNLGVYAQKKVKQKDDKKDSTRSSSASSMADRLGPEELFEWDAECCLRASCVSLIGQLSFKCSKISIILKFSTRTCNLSFFFFFSKNFGLP